MKFTTLHLTETLFNIIKPVHALPGVALTQDDDVVHLMPWGNVQPPIETVDLGDGGIWAVYNIGASTETEYGDYFAWAETSPHEGWPDNKTSHPYNWAEYKYANGAQNTLKKYCNNPSYGNNGYTDTLTQLQLEDDAAYVIYGSSFRVPSVSDFENLISKTKNNWETNFKNSGVNGWKFVNKSDLSKYMFMPCAGAYEGTEWHSGVGYYWTSDLITNHSNPNGAYPLEIFPGDMDYDPICVIDYSQGLWRCYGLTIRPIFKQ